MAAIVRAFIALEVPLEFEEDAAVLARQLSATVTGRFVPRENYHVTLAFLNEIGEGEAAGAIAALEAACDGLDPLELRPEGLGVFGRSSDGTLYLRLAETPELASLAARIAEGLRGRGVPYDDSHEYHPHITLARRAKMPKGELAGLAFPRPAVATRATLFKSTLSPEGASYKPLYSVELGA